jgi:hypothetical protein
MALALTPPDLAPRRSSLAKRPGARRRTISAPQPALPPVKADFHRPSVEKVYAT